MMVKINTSIENGGNNESRVRVIMVILTIMAVTVILIITIVMAKL